MWPRTWMVTTRATDTTWRLTCGICQRLLLRAAIFGDISGEELRECGAQRAGGPQEVGDAVHGEKFNRISLSDDPTPPPHPNYIIPSPRPTSFYPSPQSQT